MQIKRVVAALAVLAPAALATLPHAAHAADGTLYEVSEAIDLNAQGKARGFRSSQATLIGTMSSGTPLCPTWVTVALGTDSCWVVVNALGGADERTGTGAIKGTMFVLAEHANAADAPELRILSADFDGQLDLTPALFQQIPFGSIIGSYSAKGERGGIMDGYKAKESFDGLFRLPFFVGTVPSYLMDDGSVVPVQFNEFAIGRATPRLELNFTSAQK